MAKVHKGFRLDEGLAAAVSALRAEKETESACYARVIEAGVAALTDYDAGPVEEGPTAEEARQEFSQGINQGAAGGGAEPAGIVREYIESLKDRIESQQQQLDAKDAQIERLQGLAATQAIVKAEGGAWARIKAFFGGGGHTAEHYE